MGSWGEQYSTGDQGPNRVEFWRSNFKVCPSCKGSSISENMDCAGCRHNGDGYGTAVYECKDCHWITSFNYDDAAETFFYETSKWLCHHSEPPVPSVDHNGEPQTASQDPTLSHGGESISGPHGSSVDHGGEPVRQQDTHWRLCPCSWFRGSSAPTAPAQSQVRPRPRPQLRGPPMNAEIRDRFLTMARFCPPGAVRQAMLVQGRSEQDVESVLASVELK